MVRKLAFKVNSIRVPLGFSGPSASDLLEEDVEEVEENELKRFITSDFDVFQVATENSHEDLIVKNG